MLRHAWKGIKQKKFLSQTTENSFYIWEKYS